MDTVLTCRGEISPATRLTTEQLIADGVLGSAVCSASTESTNSDALAELTPDFTPPLPRLHVTESQTAGRGRQGNRWHSENDSLTFSLVADFDPHAPSAGLLSLTTGVAVAKAIEYVCAPCRITLKWPNDICMTGENGLLQKLGGILIETSASMNDRVIIGIGLNLNRSPSLTDTSSTPPVSLGEMLGRSVRRDDMLSAVVTSVLEAIDALPQDCSELLTEYRGRCALRGKDLSLKQADRLINGRCIGIADDGSLELLVDGQPLRVRSGQVQQIRPRRPGRP